MENVFFNTETGGMVFDDVVGQPLQCDGSDLCFDEGKKTFVLSSSAQPSVSRSTEYAWGTDTWVLNRRTSKLSYKTENSVVTSCSKVPVTGTN